MTSSRGATGNQPAGRTEQASANGRRAEQAMFKEIHRGIADGRLPPGTKLPEEHLADAFGVSRARTRTVLQALARDKVVMLEPNRGASVSMPSPAEARHVFAARKLVEVAISRDIVSRVDAKVLARLRRHVDGEERAQSGPDRHRLLKTSHDFHMLLAKLLRNPVIEAFLGELMARSALITAIYERADGNLCSHGSHRHLIDVLERGDPETFAAEMLRHLDEVKGKLDLIVRHDDQVDVRAKLKRRR